MSERQIRLWVKCVLVVPMSLYCLLVMPIVEMFISIFCKESSNG